MYWKGLTDLIPNFSWAAEVITIICSRWMLARGVLHHFDVLVDLHHLAIVALVFFATTIYGKLSGTTSLSSPMEIVSIMIASLFSPTTIAYVMSSP